MTMATHEGDSFTGVRPRYPAYYRLCLRPRFEVVICGEMVCRRSTRQEAELALKEILREGEDDSGDAKELPRSDS